jgi:hypothetical protein
MDRKSKNWWLPMSNGIFFDTFNAKHKTDAEIARSFVPPDNTLNQLIIHGHTVLSGPRGSGKTTLLKMVTLPALASWNGSDADALKSQMDFVSVFVAADRSWHGQLTNLTKQAKNKDHAELLGMSAFTTHIFKAIVTAFIDWRSLADFGGNFASLIPKLSTSDERSICNELAETWLLDPRAPSLLELKAALGRRLATIGLLRNQLRYGVDFTQDINNRFLMVDYREGLTSAVSAHNQASGLPDRRWCFLFDEMEVAPSFVQESIFADLRGQVDREKISYKLALAPFNKNFRLSLDAQGVSSRNDYSHIDLSYPRKEKGYDFSRKLCTLMLRQAGSDASVEDLLGTSYFAFEDDSEDERAAAGKYSAGKPLGAVFKRLAEKDASFRAYLKDRSIDLTDISSLDEQSLARSLRKVRNIVVMREYFSKTSKSDLQVERLTVRSRKSFIIYTGSPSLLALTEGNPRSLINLLAPLVKEYVQHDGKRKVNEREQADEVYRSIRVIRSLLKTIPHASKDHAGRGLLTFLDTVGNSLRRGFFSPRFSDQPPLSFRVDRGVGPDSLIAIGKALNIGALVYVPDHDSEDIISDIIGKRFRLNYLLAAHYKLPLSLDREINLSRLLSSGLTRNQWEMDLDDDL